MPPNVGYDCKGVTDTDTDTDTDTETGNGNRKRKRKSDLGPMRFPRVCACKN